MREMKERICAGDFCPVEGSLNFAVRQVEFQVPPDGYAEGFFEITGTGNGVPEGIVRCADERMTCPAPWFCGETERVAYRFDAAQMQDGQTREGRFFIVSNYGEYELPWRAQIQEQPASSSLGEIGSLLQFVNLARARWQEAVRFFYSPCFEKLCRDQEELTQLYRGLSVCRGNENNVEEFLVASHRKQPLSYTVNKKEIFLTDVRDNMSEELSVSRIGWGPVGLWAETRGDFLSLEKHRLTEDDFVGSQCRLSLFFDEGKMHGGKNFGEVILTWGRGSLTVPVTAQKRTRPSTAARRHERKLQACTYELVDLYQNYRMKKLDAADWREKAYACVRKMSDLSPEKSVAPKLFYAQLLLTEGKTQEAEWVLRRVQDWLDDAPPAVYCYYLYLTTLSDREEGYVRRTTLEIEEIFSQNPQDWRIAWLILFLSRQLGRSAARKWSFLEGQFAAGCASPVLYLEALVLLNATPTLLEKLDLTARRILLYGARHQILGRDLMMQVLSLINREKYFDPVLYRILTLYWEKSRDSETLQAVCTMLVKGGKTGAQYYPWYLRGVQEKFRITRLYEHYMRSLDPEAETEIPKSVLLYFAYQSNLDPEYAACLYAYVEKHRQEDPDLYAAYRPQMEPFVIEQLYKGRISGHLAYLYRSLLGGSLFTPDNARALAPLLCTAEVQTAETAKRLVAVPLLQEEEKVCILRRGKGYVALCSAGDMLFVEDENRNRICIRETAVRRPLFEKDSLFERTAPYAANALLFHLWAVSEGNAPVEDAAADSYRCIAQSAGVRRPFLQKVNAGLLCYYGKQERETEEKGLLLRLNPEDVSMQDRADTVLRLVSAGFYEKAYRWMWGMDAAAFDAGVLMRLCSRLLEAQLFLGEERLTQLCFQTAARGKYDARMLRHLADNYWGSAAQMEAVKVTAEGFELDTFPLCERIMVQMLYIGRDVTERMDLLRQYTAGGGSSEIQLAFLHRCAYSYVKKQQPIHGYMVHSILRLYRQKEPVGDLERLACLQYSAGNQARLSRAQEEAVGKMGEELLKANKAVPALRELAGLVPGARLWQDRTFVVYRGSAGAEVVLNYRILQEGREQDAYQSLPMQHICEGYFCTPFLLFPGESLQYYVTEAQDPSAIMESGLLKAQEPKRAGSTRYGLLCSAAAAQLEGGQRQEMETLKQYLYTDFCVNGLFGIQE